MDNGKIRPTYVTDYRACPAFDRGGRLVCGTSGLGGVWGEIDPDESVGAILHALSMGVRSFDTAPSYANAELYLGMALKAWDGEKPFISTKVGRQKAGTAFEFKLDYSNEAMEKSLHDSLRALGLERIDLLFLHEPQLVPLQDMDRIIACLHGFREQGLISYIGIGGNPTAGILPYIAKKNFDAVSGFLRLDACNLSALDSDIPLTKAEGIAYYAASSLHFSLLGNGLDRYLREGPDGNWITARDISNAAQVRDLALAHGIPFPSLAQRYLFSVAEADRVVVGARNKKQMEATLRDWSDGPLPKALFETITDIIIA